MVTVNERRQAKRDTAANWTSNNPTLLAGERGFETDTRRTKIGDGLTAYNSLAYQDDLARIAGSTFVSIQEMQDVFHSSGYTSGGTITDATAGNIDIAAGTGLIRATDDPLAELLFFDWPALAAQAITADTTRYIGVEYNAGTPRATVRTSDNFNNNTDFLIGSVINEGGTLYIVNSPHAVGDHASAMIERTHQTMGVDRDSETGGLIVSETGTRNIVLSTGFVWDRLNRSAVAALDTSITGGFDTYSASGLEASAATQWPNAQYDNAGTLTNLAANKYATLWFYSIVDDGLVMVYGTTEYNSLAAAEADTQPATLPSRVTVQGLLVARLVFKNGDATALSIESAFETSFAGSQTSDHGGLSGLLDDDHTQYLLRTDDVIEARQDVHNTTGATLVKGTLVYVSGFDAGSGHPLVTKTDADSAATMPAIGMVLADIATATSGVIVRVGEVTGLVTTGMTVNDPVYVSGTAGAFTTTAPTSGVVQEIGRVSRVHATLGEILVFPRLSGTPVNDGSSVNDVNGNEVLEHGVVASAINHVKLTNAITALPAQIEGGGTGGNNDRLKILRPQAEHEYNAQTGTTYTLVLPDQDSIVTMNNAATNTLTIPPNSSVAFPIGSIISIYMLGAGTTVIKGGTGVTLSGNGGSGSTFSADIQTRYNGASIVKIATDQWMITGDIDAVAA